MREIGECKWLAQWFRFGDYTRTMLIVEMLQFVSLSVLTILPSSLRSFFAIFQSGFAIACTCTCAQSISLSIAWHGIEHYISTLAIADVLDAKHISYHRIPMIIQVSDKTFNKNFVRILNRILFVSCAEWIQRYPFMPFMHITRFAAFFFASIYFFFFFFFRITSSLNALSLFVNRISMTSCLQFNALAYGSISQKWINPTFNVKKNFCSKILYCCSSRKK